VALQSDGPTKAANELPAWQKFLLSHSADDLLMVVGNHRLYYGGQPVSIHWLDSVSLLLIREAYERRQSLAICYPIPTCNLPVLAAAQLLIHDFVRNHPGGFSVLLVSPRTEVRQHYLNLTVNKEPLACALPLARPRAEGPAAIVPVSGRAMADVPRLYHLSQPYLLDVPWPRHVGAVVVDHVGGRLDEQTSRIHEQAARHGVFTVIHLCTDPFAAFLEVLAAAGVPVWVWDHYGLAASFGQQIARDHGDISHPFSVSARQFQNIAAGIRHHVLICNHSTLEAAARRVWDDLGTVQRSLTEQVSLGVRRAVQAAYGCFYAMFQMPAPLAIYEEEARGLWGVRPISRRIADLEAFSSLLRDEAPDLAHIYWPSLILDLKEMRDALAAGNPKYDTLVEQIHEHVTQGRSLTVVCPNRATKRMLQLCLRAREGMRLSDLGSQAQGQSISLITYRELSLADPCDTLLFPGQFSYGRRQYALAAAAPEIRYLAYGDEADRIEQQIASIHQTLAEMSSIESRERAWSALAPSGSDGALPPASGQDIPVIEFVRSEGAQVSRRTVAAFGSQDLSLWTPFSNSEYDTVHGCDTLTNEAQDALRPSEFAAESRQSVLVPALRIEFGDGFCYAEPDSLTTILLSATARTDTRRADALRPEDLVVFVDGEQRRQLYEAILERVERHPAMGVTYILVRYWQEAVRKGFFQSGMTYDRFLWKLQQQGSRMQTTPGVRCWVTGEVLGPSDPLDIHRVGSVFGDEALTQEWKEIDRALRRIRGLHISLARKLNRVIVQAGLKGQHTEASEECVDSELNLYLDDFRDSVGVHCVVAVGQSTTLVPYVLTGRFFERGTELRW